MTLQPARPADITDEHTIILSGAGEAPAETPPESKEHLPEPARTTALTSSDVFPESAAASPLPASQSAPLFPFSAVAGQPEAKLALLLAAVDPRIGGVLLRGEKGSAKTTLARGLAGVLGQERPFVNLPLGATEDRVVGTLDLNKALNENGIQLSQGLVGQAHNGVLYVDEVNLLADHLVDTLLDVAASGVNRVERDGISETHSAEFVLVGSMNPEEGELRPQLLDRFGLCVEVQASRDLSDRVDAVMRRLRFDGATIEDIPDDAEPITTDYLDENGFSDTTLQARLAEATPAELPSTVIELCCELAIDFEVEGLRSDLVLARSAAALAGLDDRPVTSVEDVRQIAPLVLGHRWRKNPFDTLEASSENIHDKIDDVVSRFEQPKTKPSDKTPKPNESENGEPEPGESEHDKPEHGKTEADQNQDNLPSDTAPDTDTPKEPSDELNLEEGPEEESESENNTGDQTPSSDQSTDQKLGPGQPPESDRLDTAMSSARRISTPPTSIEETENPTTQIALPPLPPRSFKSEDTPATGNISLQTTSDQSTTGRRSSQELPYSTHTTNPIAVAGSVRNLAQRRQSEPGAVLELGDLKESASKTSTSRLIIFVVDTSGSMGAKERASAAVGAVRNLLSDAYEQRNQVAMITFESGEAHIALSPTSSVELANLRLADLKTGGTTPLAAALTKARFIATDRKQPNRIPTIVLLTDGRATGEEDALEKAMDAARLVGQAEISTLVLDCENTFPRLGLAEDLATAMSAQYVSLDAISSDKISSAVDTTLQLRTEPTR